MQASNPDYWARAEVKRSDSSETTIELIGLKIGSACRASQTARGRLHSPCPHGSDQQEFALGCEESLPAGARLGHARLHLERESSPQKAGVAVPVPSCEAGAQLARFTSRGEDWPNHTGGNSTPPV